MRVQSPTLAAIFRHGGSILVDDQGLRLSHEASAWQYCDVLTAEWKPGLIWGDLTLSRAVGPSWTVTLAKREGAAARDAIERRVRDALKMALVVEFELYREHIAALRQAIDGPGYLRRSRVAGMTGKHDRLKSLLAHPWAPPVTALGTARLPYPDLELWLDPLRAAEARNERFVAAEKERHQQFFDSIGRSPLTDEQRTAVVVHEDRTLVSAAAGSGKSAMLVAKVGYLLASGQAQPEDILLLAFNNDAADELSARLQKDLAALLQQRSLGASTFHAFALGVIGIATGRKPSVYDAASDGGEFTALARLIDDMCAADFRFALKWTTFRALYLGQARDPAGFRSAEEWREYVRQQGRRMTDGRQGFLTLKGELVKSQGELAIANWLALHSVPYQYERPYAYVTADQHHRQYCPDFYLPDVDVYIEHWALDANGNPPRAFGEKYRQSREWKLTLHRSKATALVETTFAQWINGSLFEQLERELRARGQEVVPADEDELVEELKRSQEYEYPNFLRYTVRPFISHAKSNRVTPDALRSGAVTKDGSARERHFCALVADIMDAYQARLAQKAEVDFDDMIVMAEDCIRSGRYRSPHTVLLVDEFQDISVARARLVNALLTQRPDATLLAVGDARQAIYRFAGSDVSVFRNFEQHFGFTRRLALTRTFRFGQGLAEISNAFCDAGVTPAFSEDPARDRVVDVRLYSGTSAAPSLVRSVLDEIAIEATSNARGRASVLVLYRMNRVGEALGDLGAGRAALAVSKMSIHRSKGLEADYVILAGVTAASAGQFPCKVADDTLLQLVLPQIEPELAEERRLMYVALTRARRRAYVVASASEPSEFIAMLAKADAGQGRVFLRSEVGTPARGCQLCKRGFVVPRRGPHGTFLGCSTYPDCRFTERLEPVGRSPPRRAANRRARGTP